MQVLDNRFLFPTKAIRRFVIHFLVQPELHVMLAINYLQRCGACAVQSEEAGLLGEARIGRGLLPAQEGGSQFWVTASVRGQQLQENRAQGDADPTLRTRGEGSWWLQPPGPVWDLRVLRLTQWFGLTRNTTVPWPGSLVD